MLLTSSNSCSVFCFCSGKDDVWNCNCIVGGKGYKTLNDGGSTVFLEMERLSNKHGDFFPAPAGREEFHRRDPGLWGSDVQGTQNGLVRLQSLLQIPVGRESVQASDYHPERRFVQPPPSYIRVHVRGRGEREPRTVARLPQDCWPTKGEGPGRDTRCTGHHQAGRLIQESGIE